MDNIEKKEIEYIKKEIESVIISNNIDMSRVWINFEIGIYRGGPDIVGCFKEKDSWYVYCTDERLNMRVSGPVSLESVITFCVRSLPLDVDTKRKYTFNYDDIRAICKSYRSKEEAVNGGKTT